MLELLVTGLPGELLLLLVLEEQSSSKLLIKIGLGLGDASVPVR
jgi:hypothetical protein